CPPCREHFERARIAFRALGGTTNARAPALGRAEADLIRDALLPRPPPLARRLRWVPLAAVLAGGLAAGIVFIRPGHQPDPVVAPGHLQLAAREALLFVAIFSSKPLTDVDVRDAVERARVGGTALENLRGLPLPDTGQLLLRVQAVEARDAR